MPQSLTLLPDRYVIARLASDVTVPSWATGNFTSVTRTADELSIVCQEENVPPGACAERGWSLLKVAGPLRFDETGILASLLSPLANAGIPVFTVSTYDTDYVLLKENKIRRAKAALTGAGHIVDDPSARAAG